MNILCPSCHSSIPVSETDPLLRCDSCGLTTDLSSIGTYPGGPPSPLMRDLTGESIGDYQVSELIGVGGMGVVYRARRIADGTEVALKLLHESYAWKREEFVARFEREARALERLEHPGIVRILDSGRQDDVYYLVTEYVDGVDLARRLRGERLELGRIVDILAQVCRALGYAHANGVVHRDIKPANIMVADGEVKVLDFGLAQIAGGDSHLSSLTRTDLALGTFNYLSPEQRINAKRVDERSDIFSLGVVFYEMLTGILPLGSFRPPSQVRAGIDRRCDRIVDRSLSADPADRYQSVAELAADLQQVGAGRGRGRVALLAGTAGLVGVAAALLLALFLGSGDREPSVEDEPPDQTTVDADRGQIPPFVDVGQIQQAANAPATNAEPLANEEAQTAAQAIDQAPATPEPEAKVVEKPPSANKTGTKRPGKKKVVKGKPKKKKEPGGKGFGGKSGKLSEEPLLDESPNTKPSPQVEEPPPPPQQSQQQSVQKKPSGKTKSKGKGDYPVK